MLVFRLREPRHAERVLAERQLALDFLDLTSRQTIEEFIRYANPTIVFASDDFLVAFDESSEPDLTEDKLLAIDRLEQIGWYDDRVHRINTQIFATTGTNRHRSIEELAPRLKLDSFSKLRDGLSMLRTLNVLSGALGLCYHCFRADYDSFFSKVQIDKYTWAIDRSELDPQRDYLILLQLFLFYDAKTKILTSQLFEPNEFLVLKVLSSLLEQAKDFFTRKHFTMVEFLEDLKAKAVGDPSVSMFSKDFEVLIERYVSKGLAVTPSNPITKAIVEFLDASKTDVEQLKRLMDSSHFSKTAVFLLGMLHLRERLEEQFDFPVFVNAFIELSVRYIVNIEVTEKQIKIRFNESSLTKNRNQLYDQVNRYINEIKGIRQLQTEIERLNQQTGILHEIMSFQTAAVELQRNLEELQLHKSKCDSEIRELRSELKDFETAIHLQSLVNQLTQENEHLTKEIAERKKDVERLSRQIDERESILKEVESAVTQAETKKERLKNETAGLGRKKTPRGRKGKKGAMAVSEAGTTDSQLPLTTGVAEPPIDSKSTADQMTPASDDPKEPEDAGIK